MKKISQKVYALYQEEIQELKEKMPELILAKEITKSEGDLSENTPYDIAVAELNSAIQRQAELEDLLANAMVMTDNGGLEITIGSYVEVVKVDNQGKQIGRPKLFILDSVEKWSSGILGTDAPLGKEILNNRSGMYDVQTEKSGLIHYKVTKLKGDDVDERYKKEYPKLTEIFK